MSNVTVLGIDLAKNIFQVHGVNKHGKRILSKRLSREKLIEFMSNIPNCLVGMEACSGAHYWGRLFRSMGHTVKLMAPQFVKPYVMSNKNDINDAKGIAEAVTRPEMKFVPIKTMEQQEILLMHRCREQALKQRTALSNQIRGLLMEFGIIIPQGVRHISDLPKILEENKERLSARTCFLFMRLYEQFKALLDQVNFYDKEIERQVSNDNLCQEVLKVEGIGPITASAIVATIGDPKEFKNGREVSAWLGLVPKQHSSGNKTRLLGISKRGDSYVRKLLIHGARSVIGKCDNKNDRRSLWANDKKNRIGFNKATVALANKNARIIWALLATGECYRKSI